MLLISPLEIAWTSIGDRMDFNQSPLLVIWEVTQARDLACAHCRTGVQAERHPRELTTEEGRELLPEVKRFATRLWCSPVGIRSNVPISMIWRAIVFP
jgi:MoaA/NifB/PqqE/SkfB family radical SAM enzyme